MNKEVKLALIESKIRLKYLKGIEIYKEHMDKEELENIYLREALSGKEIKSARKDELESKKAKLDKDEKEEIEKKSWWKRIFG